MSPFQVLLVLSLAGTLFACRGYKLRLFNGRSCGGQDQVISMINQSLDLNSNCEVSSTSCSYVTPYRTATMQVSVTIGSIDFNRQSFDICSNATIPELIKVNLLALGIPTACPVTEASVFCYKGDKQFKLSKSSQRMIQMFFVTKKAKLRFTFKHDTGMTCFDSDSDIQKVLDE